MKEKFSPKTKRGAMCLGACLALWAALPAAQAAASEQWVMGYYVAYQRDQ